MENLTDEKLYELCRQYGKQALEWRNKFTGLLPEVNCRKLYLKKGFDSIFEFAFKLAGLSEAQVKLAISLEKNFSDKPFLKELLVSGKASTNKLVRVAAVATIENQKFLAEQVEMLPNRALETFVRDMKNEQNKSLHVQKGGVQNGLFESKIEELKLSDEVVGKLVELRNKGIDINELILGFLKKRVQKIEEKKSEIAKKITEKCDDSMSVTRYIPAETKKVLREEYGTKCAVPNCENSAEAMHHTARFGLVKAHNPYFMAPLCREHHVIAHSMDMNFFEKRVRLAG
ncbi:MAG: hypothetical protein WC873_00855 [Candidatus Gracilibacteria bacterium]